MKYTLNIFFLLLLISACGEREQTDITAEVEEITIHDAFFSNLNMLCGETFVGTSTYPDPDTPDHPLVGTELRAHVSSCEENAVHIDLYRDGDTWHATWIVTQREDGLHLYHDHIGDKDEDELGDDDYSGYGGYADERGSATQQFFPADAATEEMLPEAATNVWMMDMDLDEGVFVYFLERHEEPRFRAELYLQ